MNLNNIKRNQLDYLLTDILPTELSDRFTYSHFYEYLTEKSDEVKEMYKLLEKIKADAGGMFQGKKYWASMPLKYSIMKELHTVREISLVQPLAAVEILLFVGVYQDHSGDYIFTVRATGRSSKGQRGVNVTWSKKYGKDIDTKFY